MNICNVLYWNEISVGVGNKTDASAGETYILKRTWSFRVVGIDNLSCNHNCAPE